jgi:lipopolysaccharide export system protein LptA
MSADNGLRPLRFLLCAGFGCLLAFAAAGFQPSSAAKAAAAGSKETNVKEANAKGSTGKDKDKEKDKDTPINVESDKLDYYDKESKLVYSGNVVAVQGEVTLKTPVLVIFLTPKDANSQKGPPSSAKEVRRWEASGPVTFISKDEVGTGDFGSFEKAENKFHLNGNVTVTQGESVTKADHVVHDPDTGKSVFIGHVRTMFPPKNNSEDASKKDDDGARKPGKASSKLEPKPKPE